MKKYYLIFAVFGLTVTGAFSALAEEFTFSFEEWGDFKKCTNGRPLTVNNPEFKLSNVLSDAVKISFSMKDLNVPGYDHGGGRVKYTGESIIKPGAFKYSSPLSCPRFEISIN